MQMLLFFTKMLGLHIFIVFHEILFIWKQRENTAFQESHINRFKKVSVF